MSLVNLDAAVNTLRSGGAQVEVINPDEDTLAARLGWWRYEPGNFCASRKGRALTRRTYRKRTYLVVLELESARPFGDRSINTQKVSRDGRSLAQGLPMGFSK
jgi:hypothetical protein